MNRRAALIALIFAATAPLQVRADDFGPPRDVREVRSSAVRLLAHRLRASGIEPRTVRIFDVVVVRDQTLLSWTAGSSRNLMGLVRRNDRWWDAVDLPQWPARVPECLSADLVAQAALHNADVRTAAHPGIVSGPIHACRSDDLYDHPAHLSINTSGGVLRSTFDESSGFDFAMRYAANDAAPDSAFSMIYVRAPTSAEFLPNPTPPKDWSGPTDVGFFDVDIGGGKRVTFSNGTTVDVWFPFVLDDALRYDVSLFTEDRSFGPYHGTIFDNVLHFELPAFTIVPGKPLQAEISGWY